MTLPPEPPRTAATAAAALPPGTRVGDFEIRRVLGEGGFSIVYVAFDHSLHREVALKEYLPASLALRGVGERVALRTPGDAELFEAGRGSFVNEARLLAQFDHPALVKVYRFWEANGTAYMVMPLYPGQTLKQALKQRSQPPDEAWLRALLGPLLDALAMLHRQQVFHRDVAPDNILLLASGGRPLLLDFGAARRAVPQAQQLFTVILKPSFAPVEQYADVPGMQQGGWTDVYAIAAVVHFAITGTPPLPSVVRLIKDDQEPLAARCEGRYGAAFLRAIDHALAVRPEDRPASAQALAAELGLSVEVGPLNVAARATHAAAPDSAPRGAPWGASLAWFAGLWRRAATERSPVPAAPPAPDAADGQRTVIRCAGASTAPAEPAAEASAAADSTVLLGPARRAADAPALPVQLVVTACADKALVGATFALRGERLEIGREANGVRLADPLVSARHAALVPADGGCALLDLGSSNGSYLNGRRLAPMQSEPLWLGASIRLGETVLAFVRHRDAPAGDLSGATLAGLSRLERRLRASAKGALYAASTCAPAVQ